MIDQEAIKRALGDKYKPHGDYVVCGYGELGTMQSRGYSQCGALHHWDGELLIFDRTDVLQKEAAERAEVALKAATERAERDSARVKAATKAAPPEKPRKRGMFS